MKNYNEAQNETIKNIINNDIFCCQTELVYDCLAKEVFDECDIINAPEYDEETESVDEVSEWYAVGKWFAEHLKDINETVLENEYGYWWGRMGIGIAVKLDSFWGSLLNEEGSIK